MDYHAAVELPFSPSYSYAYVSQQFGQGLKDPLHYDHGKLDTYFTADQYLYYAVDIAMQAGTPVLAQCRGSVVFSRMTAANDTQGPGDHFGNLITVKCDDGLGNVFYATYMHLDKEMTVPTSVIEGQTIALSGGTGTFDTNGEHSHLHITYGSQPICYPVANCTVLMADGSLYGSYTKGSAPTYANAAGAPVFFLNPHSTPLIQDGYLHLNQNIKSDNVNPIVEVPPTALGVNSLAGTNKSSPMNGWFFGVDPNPGDTLQYWAIYDYGVAANGGYFVAPPGWMYYGGLYWPWYGGKVPPGLIVILTAQTINQVYFVGGTTSGVQDAVAVSAGDNAQFSSWHPFWVTTTSGPIPAAGAPHGCWALDVVANSALAEFKNNGFAPSLPNGERLNTPPAILHTPKARTLHCDE